MNGRRIPPPPAAGPPAPAHPAAARAAQPARTFKPTPHARTTAKAGPGDELVEVGGGLYQLRAHDRPVLNRPSGVYNFVRVQGATRNQTATLLSSRAPHAALASGRPVLYAGTAAFEAGQLQWWSNYSGTYQPNAGFARQAALPTDKFVPWQNLQLGGVGLQRGMLADRRTVPAPTAAARDGGKNDADKA